MSSIFRSQLIRIAIATAAVVVVAWPAAAATDGGHSHAADAPARLTLDQGRTWATDEPLRAGMARIRAVLVSSLDAAHAGRMSNERYAALATGIETEIAGIVANCKLEPKADAMLHLVIADLGAGADAMAGKDPGHARQDGLLKAVGAVNAYGKHFNHPGFKLIRVDH